MQRDILTDLDAGIWLDSYRVSGTDGLEQCESAEWSVSKRTLRGGVANGVDVVTVDNGLMRFELLPTRGMGLWRGECLGVPLGWRSPVRFPVHPRGVNLTDRAGFGWLQGFNEWMCRCGLESFGEPGLDCRTAGNEQQLTLHGRIANTPAHHVSVEIPTEVPDRLAVCGIVDEAALFGAKLRLEAIVRTSVGSASLDIIGKTTNLSDEPGELQILYHTNIGLPILGEGAQVLVATEVVAPFNDYSASSIERWYCCEGPTPGFAEQCYFLRPIPDEQGIVSVMLRNAKGDQAIVLSYPSEELPCVTIWKHLVGVNDGYVVGLEPGTSYPNRKSFERERKRVINLAPGQTYRTSLRIEFLMDSSEVARQEFSILQRQKVRIPRLHKIPHYDFSPDSGLAAC